MEKLAYYHSDTGEFEYKGKRRIYSCTPDVASFLRSKDKLIYVEDNVEMGYCEAQIMASYISSGYGAVYNDLTYFKNF